MVLLAAMLITAALASWFTPRQSAPELSKPLAGIVPLQFGDWAAIKTALLPVDLSERRPGEQTTDQPYDDTLMRTYRNSNGDTVMLAIAYGRVQRQEIKIHRPDLCYKAQGFDVIADNRSALASLDVARAPILANRMLAQRPGRTEAVSYWMRVGSIYADSSLATRLHILSEGLAGRIPDGVVVRASTIIGNAGASSKAFEVTDSFLRTLIGFVDAPEIFLAGPRSIDGRHSSSSQRRRG